MKCFICGETIENERFRATLIPEKDTFFAHLTCSDALRQTYSLVMDEQRNKIRELERILMNIVNNDCWVTDDYGRTYCFYCGAVDGFDNQDREFVLRHDEDCPWVKARAVFGFGPEFEKV